MRSLSVLAACYIVALLSACEPCGGNPQGPGCVSSPIPTATPSMAPPATPTPVPTPRFIVRQFSATGVTAGHPAASVEVGPGYKIVGGGALVNWQGDGNLLTASYPESATRWTASAKDHSTSSPASITVWAIGLWDPDEQWDVRVTSATSATAGSPAGSVSIPPGYVLSGGGARINWSGAGNLLTASFPSSATTWEARGKDHKDLSPASVTVWAIGVRSRTGAPVLQSQISLTSTTRQEHPIGFASAPGGWTLTGGGAFASYSGPGSLLTASYPQSDTTWSAQSKSHGVSDAAVLNTYAIAIR